MARRSSLFICASKMLRVMTPTPAVLILWLAFAHYVVFICRGDVGDFVTKDIFNEIVLRDVPLSSGGVEDIVTQAFFHGILSRAADGCEGKNFYTYNDFIVATNAFSSFGTTGTSDDNKRELVAFFANVAHETGSMIHIHTFSFY